MFTRFNVFEALEIAERVEGDGARFYLGVAQSTEDMELKQTCFKLANWKAKHSKAIAHRRKEYSDKTGEFGTFDPDDYVLSNPRVMAGMAGMVGRSSKPGAPARFRTKTELLHKAIERERETAVFYEGLKSFTRGPAGEAAIDKVLGEEKRYLDLLSNKAAASPNPS